MSHEKRDQDKYIDNAIDTFGYREILEEAKQKCKIYEWEEIKDEVEEYLNQRNKKVQVFCNQYDAGSILRRIDEEAFRDKVYEYTDQFYVFLQTGHNYGVGVFITINDFLTIIDILKEKYNVKEI